MTSRRQLSAIDCIFCALGGAFLLWASTIAINAKSANGIQSLMLVIIEIDYGNCNDLIKNPANQNGEMIKFPEEHWRLNGQALAVFQPNGFVEPKFPSWPNLSNGKHGGCNFQPSEDSQEVVSFSATYNPVSGKAKRMLLIQNAVTRVTANIEMKAENEPSRVTARIVSNSVDAQEQSRNNLGKEFEIFAHDGQLILEKSL